MIYEIGRLCVKIAGRDAGQKCIVIDNLEDNLVLIDGMTRRRKCNIAHLEPLNEIIKIKKGASEKEVGDAFKKMGMDIVAKKAKKATEKPKKAKKVNEKVTKEKAPTKEAKPKKEAVEVKETKAAPKPVKAQKSKTSSEAPAKKKATKKE
ncbi:50S ribosomal protein L14e [Candidatus Woesearchaeota archaeon]|nr:MAG: 50S ribosomal protein L14e [Candidatus Woesearchaeota archaeon]